MLPHTVQLGSWSSSSFVLTRLLGMTRDLSLTKGPDAWVHVRVHACAQHRDSGQESTQADC